MRELELEATLENLNNVLAFVDEILEAEECSMKVQTQIDIAVEEIYVNIAHYAYTPNVGKAVIRVDIEPDPKKIVFTFIDQGIPYDPTAKPDPDITLNAEQRQIGGLGIYMVKKSMEDMSYEYRDNCNVLTFKKTL